MNKKINPSLSYNQKRKILNWDIPYIVSSLEKQYDLKVMHLNSAFSIKKDFFCFDNKTAFPLSLGENNLGMILCFKVLKTTKAVKISQFIKSHLKKDKYLFPLLIKKQKEEELLKLAYNIYLQSACFSFLNTKDLQWKKGVFQNLNGVFVYIPSFYQLSGFQKKILIQELLNKTSSCHMVVGSTKNLPKNWSQFFHSKPTHIYL